MNKSQLIDKIAAGADISKAAAGRALDALIAIQKITWEDTSIANYGYNFALSLKSREKRKAYLKDSLLVEIYTRYLEILVRVRTYEVYPISEQRNRINLMTDIYLLLV